LPTDKTLATLEQEKLSAKVSRQLAVPQGVGVAGGGAGEGRGREKVKSG
jgi:hypothetical protein